LSNLIVDAIIPVKRLGNIKNRLAPILDAEERRQLSLQMLMAVVKAVRGSKLIREIFIVTPDPEIEKLASTMGAEVVEEGSEAGVNHAVMLAVNRAVMRGATAVVILPSDIPLLTTEDVDGIIGMAAEAPSMVIAPSLRFDGTNALLLRPPDAIETSYDNDSYNTHLKRATARALRLSIYLSKRVMLDVDTPEDLELLKVEGIHPRFPLRGSG